MIHRPIRVLVDSGLRVPATAKLYAGLRARGEGKPAEFQTWVLCRARARGRADIGATGARLIAVPAENRHLDLANALDLLGDLGLTTLFVEGGGGLASALLRANRVDEIHWIQAPRLIGSEGRPAIGPLSLERLSDAIRLDDITVRRRGDDVHIRAKVRAKGRR